MNETQLNKAQSKHEKYVLARHITTEGQTRSITQLSNGMWSTVNPNDPNGKNKIRAKDYPTLINKLYDIYMPKKKLDSSYAFNSGSDYRIKTMLELGCQLRILQGKMGQETKGRHERVCKSYFNKDFMNKNIKSIMYEDLLIMLNQIVIDKQPSLSEIKNIKGTLSVIFDYAVGKGIVTNNYAKLIDPRVFDIKVEEIRFNSENDNKTIEKVFSPDEVNALTNLARERINYYRYNLAGYEVLFAAITGCRSDEIPALKWSDFTEDSLWIHSQQLEVRGALGEKRWKFVPYTKNEKRKSKRKGRHFPLIDGLNELLLELKAKQDELGINSDYIFCESDGSPSTCDSYRKALGRMCRKLDFEVTNNHAFRKQVNLRLSHEGFSLEERAYMLGHSPKVNNDNYSHVDNEFAARITRKYRENMAIFSDQR